MSEASILTTTKEVVTALGGTKAVALLTSRKYTAAANWSQKPTFPSNTFLQINGALAAKGLSADPALWRMTNTG